MTNLGRGCGHMRRFLALLFVCTVSLLMQGGASLAHVSHPTEKQAVSAVRLVHATAILTPIDEADCEPVRGCCRTVCAQCQSFRLAYVSDVVAAPFETVMTVFYLDDRVRSVVVGRDPPVPKVHRL